MKKRAKFVRLPVAAFVVSVAAGPLVPHAGAVEFLYTLTPAANNVQLGSSFAALGDVDGDGVVDFAVGDRSFKSGSFVNSGVVYVVSGASGSILRQHEGVPATSQFFGASLAAVDIDGDGVLDLAVGAPGHRDAVGFGAGSVTIYSGADGSLISRTVGPSASQYGSALADAGDQDGDGIHDLFVGAPVAVSSQGRVYVQSGADGSVIWTAVAPSSFSSFGLSLAALDDIDGDGRKDLAVGAPASWSAGVQVGRVHLFRSSDGSLVASRQGVVLYERLGESLAAVADADGDGLADVLVGSYSGGVCRLLSGADLAPIEDLSISGLASYQPVVAGGGLDADADGVEDWLIGIPGFRMEGTARFGAFRIVSGADRSTLHEWEASVANSGLGSSLAALPGSGFAVAERDLVDPTTGGKGSAHFWKVETGDPDSDGDGVPDSVDAVPFSNLDPTVVVFGGDSGVENRVDETGTSLADRFAGLEEAQLGGSNQGRLVPALNALLRQLRADGLLTKAESKAIHRAAVLALAHGKKKR